MEIEIDVSGDDLLNKDYVVCVANNNGIIKGFKFKEKLVKDLSSKYGQMKYKYKKSKRGKSSFRVRLYSIVVYYLFKDLGINETISLKICKDFSGKENDIKENLKFFLIKKLELKIENISFEKLDKKSLADEYAYLMRKDKKNKMNTYININLEDFEKWLKK